MNRVLSAFLILGYSILTIVSKYLSQIENEKTLGFLNELEHENEKYFNTKAAKATLDYSVLYVHNFSVGHLRL